MRCLLCGGLHMMCLSCRQTLFERKNQSKDLPATGVHLGRRLCVGPDICRLSERERESRVGATEDCQLLLQPETHMLQRIKARRNSCTCSPHVCHVLVVASVMLYCGKNYLEVLLTAVRTCSIPAGSTTLMWQHGSLLLLGCVVRSRKAHPCLCGVTDTSGGAALILESSQFPVLWVVPKQAAQHQLY